MKRDANLIANWSKVSKKDLAKAHLKTLDRLEKVETEVSRLNSQLDIAVGELNKAEAGNKILEAQCAILHEALEQVSDMIDDAECRDDLDGIRGHIDDTLYRTDNAGQKMLERMRKLEDMTKAAQNVVADFEETAANYPQIVKLAQTLAALGGDGHE